MFKPRITKHLFIVALLISLVFPGMIIFLLSPKIEEVVVKETTRESFRLAEHIKNDLLYPQEILAESTDDSVELKIEFERIKRQFNLYKISVFNSVGEVVYSTDPRDIGYIATESFFRETLSQGEQYATYMKRGANSLEGVPLEADVMETYQPIMKGDSFLGAIEIYYDITDALNDFRKLWVIFASVLFVVGFLSCFAVIVMSRKAEETKTELESERIKSEAIVGAIGDSIVVQDRDYRIIYQNHINKEMFGDHEGEFCFSVYEDREDVCDWCPVSLTYKDGKVHSCERSISTPKGTRHMELVASPMRDHKGHIVAGVKLIRDVTEHKEADERIQESERLFRGAFENVSVGSSVCDLTGRFIKVNRFLCEMLGYSEEEMLTKTFSDVTHPDDVQIGLEAGKKLISGEMEYASFEKRYIRKDGQIINVIISPTVIRSDDGKPQHFMALFQDITERKKAEEKIKTSLKEKEVLLQEIHHRVKNNMQVISSLLKLQASRIEDEETVKQFTESQNRIRSMALIHEKLYLSEDLSNIGFRQYVYDLTESLKASFGMQAASIRVIIEMDDITLNTETAIPCGLILNELISNSIKYAFPKGEGGEVRIAVKKSDGGEIEIVVADNGVGIPEGAGFENPASLGLELVSILAKEQLGGIIELNTDHGTMYKIRVRELDYRSRI